MTIKIFYGITENKIDVTDICLSKLLTNDIITIPESEISRTNYFSDPLLGTLKSVFILINDNLYEYPYFYKIKIDITNNTISTISSMSETECKLKNIHLKLNIKYGTFSEEYPEQLMAIKYLSGTEKVLEIGGNIGRNSLIIASILNNNNHLVTLESDTNIANQLTENRNLNNLNFHIENAALSKRKLIQTGWDTMPSDILLEGYHWVNTITFDELKNKYNIEFDTLILDCEGAFYYILMDMPEILENVNLIIMENDYYDISKKQFVDEILRKNNFILDYVKSGGWGPCENNFFEVWKK